MCGRTSLFQPQPEIERRFGGTFEHSFEPRYNIAPNDNLAVIHDAAPETITSDQWGFVPEWADAVDEGPRPINARAETVAENRLFSTGFEQRRALVLADGYYEWAGSRGGKQPYRITVGDDSLFAMAGLWSKWEGNSETLSTVTILTTEPSEAVASIHDRMPVILDRAVEDQWLEAEPDRALDLVSSYDGDLRTQQISTLVNDPANDSPAVIDPIGGDYGQTGLDDYGTN